ncbi:MAG: DUF4388 domain-containing protein, partial [Myxococcales bacterium]|nr:DUF4388 domain-containing protein [Myxococcales bacterium]
MRASPLAEVLYRAHKEKATGYVRVQHGERRAILAMKDGDVVGVEVGFGYQSVAQALLQAERIDPGQFDALWARGEGG